MPNVRGPARAAPFDPTNAHLLVPIWFTPRPFTMIEIDLIAALVASGEKSGVNRSQLLEDSNIDESVFQTPDARLTFAQQDALWETLGTRLNSECVGLEFASSVRSARPFGTLGYLSRSAPNWGEAVGHVARYSSLLGLASAQL